MTWASPRAGRAGGGQGELRPAASAVWITGVDGGGAPSHSVSPAPQHPGSLRRAGRNQGSRVGPGVKALELGCANRSHRPALLSREARFGDTSISQAGGGREAADKCPSFGDNPGVRAGSSPAQARGGGQGPSEDGQGAGDRRPSQTRRLPLCQAFLRPYPGGQAPHSRTPLPSGSRVTPHASGSLSLHFPSCTRCQQGPHETRELCV